VSYKLGDKFSLGYNVSSKPSVEVSIVEIMPSGLYFKVDKSSKLFSIKSLHSKGSTYTSGEYLVPIKSSRHSKGGEEKAELGSLLIGAGIGVAGKYLYDNYKKSEVKSEPKAVAKSVSTKPKEEKEDEITKWMYRVDKDGYENVFGGGKDLTQRDIKDTQLRTLANQYNKNFKELNSYIPKIDTSEENKEYLESSIDKEGFDYALSGYHDWKEIKDPKFHKLRKEHESLLKKLDKYLGFNYADGGVMKKGGMSNKKVTFDDKVKAIQSSLLKRKKVSPKVQEDYGKTYSRKEALQSAKRIAGSMRKKGK
jgi:hypothetical protein